MRKPTIRAGALALALALAAACGEKEIERRLDASPAPSASAPATAVATPRPTPDPAYTGEAKSENGALRLDFHDGDGRPVSISIADEGAAKLPADFPDDVWIPPAARLEYAFRHGDGFIAYLSLDEPRDKAAEAYGLAMQKLGWERTMDLDKPASSETLSAYSKGNATARVIAGPWERDNAKRSRITIDIKMD